MWAHTADFGEEMPKTVSLDELDLGGLYKVGCNLRRPTTARAGEKIHN